jgi:hypothetical protein
MGTKRRMISIPPPNGDEVAGAVWAKASVKIIICSRA